MIRENYNPLTTPYELDERAFPETANDRERYMFLLRYAVLAPSSHNTQPWKFALYDDGIAVFADYTRRLPVVDPNNRELLMSIGAVLMNLRVAAAQFGFNCRIAYNHSGDSELPVAFVGLTPRGPSEISEPLAKLFPAITRRHTNRNPFLVARIPDSVARELRNLDKGGRASFLVSTDGSLNCEVADLVALADKLQQRDPEFRKELADWIRTNWTRRPDGMTGSAFGVGDIPAAVGPWAVKVLDLGHVRAANDKNLCGDAPGLIVIYGEDSVPVWIEVGELLEELLLTITGLGLHYGFFNMPIEVPALRTQLKGLLNIDSWPQLLLRMGHCLTQPPSSPRRPVEDVIITSAKQLRLTDPRQI